ncbi:MAG: DUF5615 family PIN-like protein [Chloroflexi bacterium]|nr:DUF5615 family PIN-like protein [Chloroflexota bacterium]
MSRLFAEVYLDEDVSVLVAALLRSRGFRSVTTRDAGQLGQSDSAQLDYATDHSLLFLTHNRTDFKMLHREYLSAHRDHWGIVIASRRVPTAIAGNLLRLLNRMTADELRNLLLYI